MRSGSRGMKAGLFVADCERERGTDGGDTGFGGFTGSGGFQVSAPPCGPVRVVVDETDFVWAEKLSSIFVSPGWFFRWLSAMAVAVDAVALSIGELVLTSMVSPDFETVTSRSEGVLDLENRAKSSFTMGARSEPPIRVEGGDEASSKTFS